MVSSGVELCTVFSVNFIFISTLGLRTSPIHSDETNEFVERPMDKRSVPGIGNRRSEGSRKGVSMDPGSLELISP